MAENVLLGTNTFKETIRTLCLAVICILLRGWNLQQQHQQRRKCLPSARKGMIGNSAARTFLLLQLRGRQVCGCVNT